MASPAARVWWAAIPMILWLVQVTLGLLAGSALCEARPLGHGITAVFLAGAIVALFRSGALPARDREDFPSRVIVIPAFLFTAGIALTWIMVAVAPCG